MKDLCLTDENFVKLKALIMHENLRQLEKWGVQDHSPESWLMFATEELGETAQAIGECEYRGGLAEDVVKEAIQTATLMLKIAEMFQDLLVTPNKEVTD
jgi:hypothetical protein